MRQIMKKILFAGLFGGLLFASFAFFVPSAAVEKIAPAVQIHPAVQIPQGMKAKELFELSNKERNGKLKWNDCMAKQAEKRAKYIVANNYIEHEGLDGKLQYPDMIEKCFAWIESGENLAAYFDSSATAHEALMASPTHKANIMSPKFHQMGVGCFDGVCVQFFAN